MQEKDNTNKTFEEIKHIDENGIEFWYARELSCILGYKEWRNFNKVLDKAKEACKNSGFIVKNDFVEVNKIVEAVATSKKINEHYKNIAKILNFNDTHILIVILVVKSKVL